jgi:hypothetical protein
VLLNRRGYDDLARNDDNRFVRLHVRLVLSALESRLPQFTHRKVAVLDVDCSHPADVWHASEPVKKGSNCAATCSATLWASSRPALEPEDRRPGHSGSRPYRRLVRMLAAVHGADGPDCVASSPLGVRRVAGELLNLIE